MEEKNEPEPEANDEFVDSSTARQVELDRVLAEMLQAIEDRRLALVEQLAELLQEREDEKEEEKNND